MEPPYRNARWLIVAASVWVGMLCMAAETFEDQHRSQRSVSAADPARERRMARSDAAMSLQRVSAALFNRPLPRRLLPPMAWSPITAGRVPAPVLRPADVPFSHAEAQTVTQAVTPMVTASVPLDGHEPPQQESSPPAEAAVPEQALPDRPPAATSTASPPPLPTPGERAPEVLAQWPRPVPPAPRPAAPSLAGWAPFVLKKSVEEIAEAQRQEPARPVPQIKLPPTHDILPLSMGLSHLAKADWGFVANGSGTLFGRQADVSTFLTAGPLGIVPRSGRVSLFDPARNTHVEGGELFSDLRGSSLGARVTWKVAGSRPAVSVYLREAGSPTPTLVSYRQQFDVGRHLQFGGEVGSNASGFVRATYSGFRVETDAYYRHRPEWGGRDTGISAGVDLWRGILLSGAMRVSNSKDDTSTWRLARLRVPLPKMAAVSFERSVSAADSDRSVSALMVQMPFKRVQFIQRLQFGHTAFRRAAVPTGFDGRVSQTATNVVPGRWGNFTYQQSTQWFDDEHVAEWDEISTTLKFGRKTTLQATTALPDLRSVQRLRARLKQDIGHRMSIDVQYGMLSAFQLTRNSSVDETPTVMVTLSKIWHVATPARGGNVRGQVLDQAHRPVADVPVKLGPYRTVTDDRGQYRFARVPSGTFDVALDREKLPVSYASEDAAQAVTITTTTSDVVDFELMPLNAIRGRVYIDRNRNNAFDASEGVAGVPVAIGTWLTATEANGAFAFYNQPPGSYVVRLDLAHLPDNLVPASDAELDVELPVDRPLTGLEFRVQPKVRPLVMQTLQ